jgi:hypothetical protein
LPQHFLEFGQTLLESICKHFNISVTDSDKDGPLNGMSISLSFGLNIDQMVLEKNSTKKVIKVKKPKKKPALVVSTSGISQSIESLSLPKYPVQS